MWATGVLPRAASVFRTGKRKKKTLKQANKLQKLVDFKSKKIYEKKCKFMKMSNVPDPSHVNCRLLLHWTS